MANRRWKKNNMQKKAVSNGRVATAPLVPPAPPAPVRQIEFKTVIHSLAHPIRWDDEELEGLVNAGWQIAHETVNTYYHPPTDSTCHSRIVRLSRMVDAVPSPVIKQEVEVHPTPSPSPVDEEGTVSPFTVVIEPMVDAVPVPTCGCYQPAW